MKRSWEVYTKYKGLMLLRPEDAGEPTRHREEPAWPRGNRRPCSQGPAELRRAQDGAPGGELAHHGAGRAAREARSCWGLLEQAGGASPSRHTEGHVVTLCKVRPDFTLTEPGCPFPQGLLWTYPLPAWPGVELLHRRMGSSASPASPPLLQGWRGVFVATPVLSHYDMQLGACLSEEFIRVAAKLWRIPSDETKIIHVERSPLWSPVLQKWQGLSGEKASPNHCVCFFSVTQKGRVVDLVSSSH